MQLRAALKTGLETLLQNQVPSAQLAAELLLMDVLHCDRAFLYSNAEIEVPPEKTERYFLLVDLRSTGKPTQYITGHQEFWGLDFEVTPDVLIPRPETEHAVERVLELARRSGLGKDARLRIVDVGTGSGCIALALASELPRAILFGADISRPALVVASRNAVRLGMPERVKFLESDLLARFLDKDFLGTIDFVVSNPPYVGKRDIEMVQREVRQFEPRIAWGGLERGDEIYARLFPQALEVLKPGGYVVVEIGYNMRDQVLALLGDDWKEIEVMPDLAGIPRVVSAKKRESGVRSQESEAAWWGREAAARQSECAPGESTYRIIIHVAAPKCGEETIMSEPEEEDLTKLQLQNLIERAYKIAKQMVREGASQKTAEGLFAISSELRKKVCGNLQEPSSPVAPRRHQIKIAERPIGNGIRGSRTKGLPRSGGGRWCRVPRSSSQRATRQEPPHPARPG